MQILWLDIYSGKYLDFLARSKNPNIRTLVFTPNPEILLKAHRDDDFYEVLKKADFLVPDATGLYTASLIKEEAPYLKALFMTFFKRRELEKKYGEIIQGSNLTKDLVAYAIEEWSKILMIDNYRIDDPQNEFEKRKMVVQGKLPELFSEKFPNLDVEILFDGEMSDEKIAELIREKNIKYVFACIGMKLQEKRLVGIFSHLPDNQKVLWIWVGSSFDYLLGLQKRAPEFFQKFWIEWLYRFLQDPKRRWRRIKAALIDFPRLIQSQK